MSLCVPLLFALLPVCATLRTLQLSNLVLRQLTLGRVDELSGNKSERCSDKGPVSANQCVQPTYAILVVACQTSRSSRAQR